MLRSKIMATRMTGHTPSKKILFRVARIAILFVVAAWSIFAPISSHSQEHIKVIYSQFTMTNSATWFAREAGLFERHGLAADLIYVDSAPAVQALTAGAAPLATMSGGLAVGPYLNGLDLVMLARWCNLNSYQLITRPEIRRVEEIGRASCRERV